MYYRQKILLALLETNQGKLASTDLEKLLFLFCQLNEENYYDFFPYKFGAFSFISYYDKRKLIAQGILKDKAQFELATQGNYLQQLKASDRKAILKFSGSVRHLRGNNLVRKTYLEFPTFASRSEIHHEVLTSSEINKIKKYWNTHTEPILFTIGYEGISIDEYLSRLITQNIQSVIDVRKNPFSRKHGFSKKQFQKYCIKAGINYFHLPDLGISSHMRKNLNGVDSYSILFQYYSESILPNQSHALNELTQLIKQYKRVALTCFENNYCMCHRHKISDYFSAKLGFDDPVIHL